MRAALIIFQAAILSLLAVVGAMGDSGQKQTCPLSSSRSGQYCTD
jgi:hypothetical protein